MSNAEQLPDQYFDMDHVRIEDGRIYRLLGNFAVDDVEQPKLLGYNLYSPSAQGDRLFRGEPYTKNYTEDTTNPRDVLETYDLLSANDIVEYFDPVQTAQERRPSYDGTVWADLYDRLTDTFGTNAIGIFGSALPGNGLHLNPDGTIKNDVDFFIEGIGNVPVLAANLPYLREGLGFTDYSPTSQSGIIESWKKVFKNPRNSLAAIMDRRWSGMQLDGEGRVVLNTFRFRDRNEHTPAALLDADNMVENNVEVVGVVTEAEKGNLYPRLFTVESAGEEVPVHSFWWKFSSPVNKGDRVSLCGDLLDVRGRLTLRLTNYEDHWLGIQ